MRFSLQPPWWEARVAEFRTLRLSLNAPVIAIDELPVGPARAGIALGVDSSGSLRLQIAIRSLQTGQVIAFAPGDDPAGEDEAVRVLEAGFSFAEGMGFLFDDDEVAVRETDELNVSWRELIGEAAMRGAVAGAPDVDATVEPPVFDLIHEVSVQTEPAGPIPVRIPIDFDSPALAVDGNDCAAVLSKHRLILGGVGTGADARTGNSLVGEVLESASARAQDTRIRLLGRF